jgi:hypothetical protein
MVCFSALKKCVNCNVGGFDIASNNMNCMLTSIVES